MPLNVHFAPPTPSFFSVLRDISERQRDLEQVLTQYITFVKPAFEEFCLPVSIMGSLIIMFYGGIVWDGVPNVNSETTKFYHIAASRILTIGIGN